MSSHVTCAGCPSPTPPPPALFAGILSHFLWRQNPVQESLPPECLPGTLMIPHTHSCGCSLCGTFPSGCQGLPSPTHQLTEARDGSCHLPIPRIRLACGRHLAVILSD